MSDQHVIGSGFTDQELALASWWVRHQPTVKRLGYGALIGASTLLWGYTLWTLLDSYIISEPRESRIIQRMVQNTVASGAFEAAAPQPITPSEVTLMPGTDNRQDMLIQLSNANTKWWAEFTYYFADQGGETPRHKTYILPNSQRYLTELGWKGKNALTSPQVVIEDIKWHRLDPNKVDKDYTAFSQKRLQFTFDDVSYKKDLLIGTQQVGQTNFILNNPTGYGFWSTQVTILLYRADSLAAFTTIDLKEIKPNESRPITINWFDNLTGISKTEIRADVNVLDPAAYLPGQRF